VAAVPLSLTTRKARDVGVVSERHPEVTQNLNDLWGPTSTQSLSPQTRARSDSVDEENIDCFGGSLYLLSDHNAAPLVRITRSTQEHPMSTRGTDEHPRAPQKHPGAHLGASRSTPGATKSTQEHEQPPRVSVYDVISAMTGLDGNNAGRAYRDLVARFTQVQCVPLNLKLPGKGQRNTPIVAFFAHESPGI
jgi:hypothetical protein